MPRRVCVGEDGDEGLLSIEDPSGGNEKSLEELCPVEVAYDLFYCGAKRRKVLFVRG